MSAADRQGQDTAAAVWRMPQLKVPEVDAAVGKSPADGCHLSRPVLERDAHDTETMSQRRAEVAGILKGRCELFLGLQNRCQTVAKPLDRRSHLATIGGEDVHPDRRVGRRDACEISETAGRQVHGSWDLSCSLEKGRSEDLRHVANACDSRVMLLGAHSYRSSTKVRHDPLDTFDVLLVRPIGNHHPRRTPEESSTGRVRSGHLAARHRVCADESRGTSRSDDRTLDRRNIDHQCRGVKIRNCSEHGGRRRCEHEQVIGTQGCHLNPVNRDYGIDARSARKRSRVCVPPERLPPEFP